MGMIQAILMMVGIVTVLYVVMRVLSEIFGEKRVTAAMDGTQKAVEVSLFVFLALGMLAMVGFWIFDALN